MNLQKFVNFIIIFSFPLYEKEVRIIVKKVEVYNSILLLFLEKRNNNNNNHLNFFYGMYSKGSRATLHFILFYFIFIENARPS